MVAAEASGTVTESDTSTSAATSPIRDDNACLNT
jgi:hypothetical protein